MAMEAFEEDIARPFGVAARGGAALPTVFAYAEYKTAGTFTATAPANTKGFIAHAIGGGGPGNSSRGGGGAYSSTDPIPCAAGASLSVSVGAGGSSEPTDGSPSSVSIGGTVVCLAEGGGSSNGATGGRGGRAANGIGKVRRSGGAGGNGTVASTPPEGGNQTVSTTNAGNAAGNFGAPAGGPGENSSASQAPTAPGGGGGVTVSNPGAVGGVLIQWVR